MTALSGTPGTGGVVGAGGCRLLGGRDILRGCGSHVSSGGHQEIRSRSVPTAPPSHLQSLEKKFSSSLSLQSLENKVFEFEFSLSLSSPWKNKVFEFKFSLSLPLSVWLSPPPILGKIKFLSSLSLSLQSLEK